MHETIRNPFLLEIKEIYESEEIVTFIYREDGASFDPNILQNDNERLNLILQMLVFFLQISDLKLSVTEFSPLKFVQTGIGSIKIYNFDRLAEIGSV